MTRNDSTQRRRQSSRQRPDEREARKAARSKRTSKRSVGADVLSLPASRALGLENSSRRPYGRGTTARRVASLHNQEQWQDSAEQVEARPAVYTGEARDRSSRKAKGFEISRAGAVIITIVAIIAIALVAIAGPARTYYHAWRDSGVLQVEYEVLQKQNAELDHELNRLQTLEGIEDEARSRGYVYPNEEALVVEGIEEEQIADPAEVQQAIDAYEEGLPWYVHWLDTVFGYERS